LGPKALRGTTLVEFVVASGVLSGMILTTGLIFSQASDAVTATRAYLDASARVRTASAQLREDFRSLIPLGHLIVSNGDEASGRPPFCMMMVAGRFVSQTDVDEDGRPVMANAAVVVYTLGEEVQGAEAATGKPRPVLCRYVYLLTGSGDSPCNLQDLKTLSEDQAGGAADENYLDATDTLGACATDLTNHDPLGSAIWPVCNTFAYPIELRYQQIQTAPTVLDNPVGGGVRQLWPYMVGGVERMEFAYHDGYAADGRTEVALGRLAWHELVSEATQNRGHLYNPELSMGGTVFWNRRTLECRPKALRVRLTMAGTKNVKPQVHEIIINVPS